LAHNINVVSEQLLKLSTELCGLSFISSKLIETHEIPK